MLIDAFRTLGAEVVPMPMARPVIDALAQGDLDGVETDIDAIDELGDLPVGSSISA